MNILARFFRRLIGLFRKAEIALSQIETLIPDALFIVEMIAKATPTRADDDIVQLAREYALGPVVIAQLHAGNRDEALRMIARVALQKHVRLSIKDSVANAAIELAYTVFRNQ